MAEQKDAYIEKSLEILAELMDIPFGLLELEFKKYSFTNLGGTSLIGAEFLSRFQKETSRTFKMKKLLSDLTIHSVLSTSEVYIYPKEFNTTKKNVDFTSRIRGLLPGQKSMLLSEEMYGGSAYHLMFSIEFKEPINIDLLKESIIHISKNNDTLRTMFLKENHEYYRNVLEANWIPPIISQPIEAKDPKNFVNTIHEQLGTSSRNFLKLFSWPPVYFVISKNLSYENHFAITILIHHALIDGLGIGLLWRELLEFYNEKKVTYRLSSDTILDNFLEFKDTNAAELSLTQRVEQLKNSTNTLELPSDLKRPLISELSGKRIVFSLSKEDQEAILALAQKMNVTRNVILLSAWAITIARRTGKTNFLIGVPVAQTENHMMNIIALKSKLVPVLCKIEEHDTVENFIKKVSKELLEAVSYADIPFEELVNKLGVSGDLARNPLVQVVFAPHDELLHVISSGSKTKPILHEGHCGGSAFDMTLFVQKWGEESQLCIEYADSVFLPDEVMTFIDSYITAIQELNFYSGDNLQKVRTISKNQNLFLESMNNEELIEFKEDIWHEFLKRAKENSSQVCVSEADKDWTYEEILLAAIATSTNLYKMGLREDDCILLSLPKSSSEIISILAIARLGAAYVALDAFAPKKRIESIISTVKPKAIISVQQYRIDWLSESFPEIKEVDIYLKLNQNETESPEASSNLERPIYIAFTSGSTGSPKGVRVTNKAVLRLTNNNKFFVVENHEKFLRLAPLAFDASTFEIFTPLLQGGILYPYPDIPVSPTELATFLENKAISSLWLTAGLFRLVVDHGIEGLGKVRNLYTGGDVVPLDQANILLNTYPEINLVNGYGPTENTVFTTTYKYKFKYEIHNGLPIGKPVPGTGIYVLDSQGRAIPPGGIGELFASGVGLAVDYIGLQKETNEVFKYNEEIKKRTYATGDLVRWDRFGNLNYIGRKDNQIKIRGFRIELDEIRRAIMKHTSVKDAVVIVIGDGNNKRILAGIIKYQKLGGIHDLRSFLNELLPSYAIPNNWIYLNEFPITKNGKIDAKQLEHLSKEFVESKSPVELNKENETHEDSTVDYESIILDIWIDVLEDNNFDKEARFYDIGGNSLTLAKVHSILKSEFKNFDISIIDLFKYPTIRELANFIKSNGNKKEPKLNNSINKDRRRINKREVKKKN